MAENSKIEWTTHTFNPWRGCTKVSAGCAHCYAETLSGRNPKVLGMWGPNGTRVVAAESAWNEPVKWNREASWCGNPVCKCAAAHKTDGRCACGLTVGRPRVFCASLADVFEDWAGPMVDAKGERLYWPHDSWNERRPWVPISDCGGDEKAITMHNVRARLFNLIDATPNLDWLLLTKRPENLRRMIEEHRDGIFVDNLSKGWPNVWLGTSVESQAAADERIPHLLRVPAAVRFLSCDPLLRPVILHKYFAQCECGHGHGFTACPNTGGVAQTCHQCDCRKLKPKIGWVIVGGESGPGARPCNVAWIRSIVEQCKAAGVPCFVKQLGSLPVMDGAHRGEGIRDQTDCRPLWRMKDKKGGDPAEWAEDLRVRRFPEVKA